MEPGQYTGKTGATPGEPPRDERAPSDNVPSPVPASASRAGTNARAGVTRRASTRRGGDMMRVVVWGAVLAALVAGLVMYFRYERAVVPLFGRGR